MQKNLVHNQTEQKDEADEEILDFSKPDYSFIPKEYHDWRQQGPFIVCKSCECQHAVYIGMSKILTGFNEKGQPILKRR
jgi:hypothetical protein